MRPDQARRKISGTAILKDVLKRQPADVGGERRTDEIREACAVLGEELRPPIDVDIAGSGFGATPGIG